MKLIGNKVLGGTQITKISTLLQSHLTNYSFSITTLISEVIHVLPYGGSILVHFPSQIIINSPRLQGSL